MEGFAVARNKTCIESEELEGKELWLFRLPKDVSIDELNGQLINIPKSSSAPAEIATIDADPSNLVLRKADNVERDAFHVLLADEDSPYMLGPRFQGMISVQKLPKTGSGSAATVKRVVPYEFVPQNKELTVRFMPLGSTTSMQELQETLAERAPPSTEVKKKKKKDKKRSLAPAEEPAEEKAEEEEEAPRTEQKDKKKKKRKSSEHEKERTEPAAKKKKEKTK